MSVGCAARMRIDGDEPEARGFEKVMFLTPVPALGLFGIVARMRDAASSCLACNSGLLIIRARAETAARRGSSTRATVPNMLAVEDGCAPLTYGEGCVVS